MNEDAEHVMLVLPRGERGEIRVSRSRFKGYVSTKFHFWYPGDDGELHPGRQCISLRDPELADVIEALKKIASRIGPQPPREQRAPRDCRTAARSGDLTREDRSDEMRAF